MAMKEQHILPEVQHYIENETVNWLIQSVLDLRIDVSPLPTNDDMENRFLREVILRIDDCTFPCLADNECGDMDMDNLPLKLSMILMELDSYESTKDFLEWCDDQGLEAGSALASRLWRQLQENAVEIPKFFNEKVKVISAYDWHLGAGGIQELRTLSYQLARPDLHRNVHIDTAS